jgi:hypothetical protein
VMLHVLLLHAVLCFPAPRPGLVCFHVSLSLLMAFGLISSGNSGE